MATSFLRAPKRKTRSDACSIVGESVEVLSHSILPSKSDIIRNINYRKDLLNKIRLNQSDWSIIYKEITSELVMIWSRGACIPVEDEKNIKTKLKKLYEQDYVSLKKTQSHHEKDPENHKIWLENVGKDLSQCFEIVACPHVKNSKSREDILSAKCNCVAAKKVPHEELEFYASQIFDRGSESMLVIGSNVDMKGSQRYNQKRQRLEVPPTPPITPNKSTHQPSTSFHFEDEIDDEIAEENLEFDPDFVLGSTETEKCYTDYSDAVQWALRFDGPSNRMIAGLINIVNRINGIADRTSAKKIGNDRNRLTERLRSKHYEEEREKPDSEKICMGFDGKKSLNAQAHSKTVNQENVTVQDGITAKFLGLLKPEDGSGKALANELNDLCEKTKRTECTKAVKADGCPVNVGGGDKMEGAIYHLEILLQCNVQYCICGLHLNELILRHLMVDCWGFVIDGPYSFKDPLGKLVINFKKNLQGAVKFDPIPTGIPEDIPAELLENNDQKYMFKLLMAINNGHLDATFLDERFMQQSPGIVGHARWLNTLNNCGRLLVQCTKPSKRGVNNMGMNLEQYNNLKKVVTFGTQFYAKVFFAMKQKSDIKFGSMHFFDMIQIAKKILNEEEMEVFKTVMTNNSFLAHSEMVLYGAVLGNNKTEKRKAINIIRKIRSTKSDDELRKYLLPKGEGEINWNAKRPFQLVKKFESVPPLFRGISTEELDNVIMPHISLTNVSIERGVKNSAEAAKKAIGRDAQEGLILSTEQSRNEIPTNWKKSDFSKKS